MRDRLTSITLAVLRLFTIANLVFGVVFAFALVLSFPFDTQLSARLIAKYGTGIDAGGILASLRAMAIGGVIWAAIVHQALTPLRAIVGTIGYDPFEPANADRLTRIGWSLLGLQLLDLSTGALIGWFRHYGVETATWTPHFSGWLGVLLAFVLARVFRRGAEMRDDIAMTV